MSSLQGEGGGPVCARAAPAAAVAPAGRGGEAWRPHRPCKCLNPAIAVSAASITWQLGSPRQRVARPPARRPSTCRAQAPAVCGLPGAMPRLGEPLGSVQASSSRPTCPKLATGLRKPLDLAVGRFHDPLRYQNRAADPARSMDGEIRPAGAAGGAGPQALSCLSIPHAMATSSAYQPCLEQTPHTEQ